MDDERIRLINDEQRRQMEIHKWIVSEKSGRDIGETALFGWVENYAAEFRCWANQIPYECIQCGLICSTVDNMCPRPFDEHRIRFWFNARETSKI